MLFLLFIILGLVIFGIVFTIIIVNMTKTLNDTPSTTPIPITSSTTPSPPNFPGNLIVAVGTNSTTSPSIVYSTDNGITWTPADSSNKIFSVIGNAISYNGYIYVAGGQGSFNSLAYSRDGMNWIGLGTSIFSQVSCIHWTGNQFIAGGIGTTTSLSTFAHSSDGINWQLSNDMSSLLIDIVSITSSSTSGKIIACGSKRTGVNMISSTDGINWILIPNTSIFLSGSSLYWTGTSFLAGGYITSTIARSIDDGITWNLIAPSPFSNTCTGFASNGLRIVAVGIDETVGNSTIAYSDDDGQTWNLSGISNVPTGGVLSVVWDGTYFIAGGVVGLGNNNLVYSPDGINWINNTVTALATFNSLIWNGTLI
jgi:hypothetical protein